MACPFVQLHVHSSYSFYDGLEPPDGLAEEAKAKGMPGLGLTDHGVAFGAPAFFKACKKQGIKGVIGMEAYEAVPHAFDPERDTDVFKVKWADLGDRDRYFHLTIWVVNATGWQNLCALHTISHSADFKHKNKALIDRAHLEAHSEGLMIGLGCIASKTSQGLIRGSFDPKAAYDTAAFYVDRFGRDNVVMELTNNLPEQMQLLRPQRKLAGMLGIDTLAINDVHYRKREHGVQEGPHHALVKGRRWKSAEVEETSGDKSDEGYGQWYGTDGLFMKDGAEMLAAGGLEAKDLEKSMEILDRVSFDFDALPAPKPPIASVPAPGDDPGFDLFVSLQAGT